MLLVCFFVALLFFDLSAEGLIGLAVWLLICAALILGSVLLFPQLFLPVVQLFCRLIGRFVPRLSMKITQEIEKAMQTLMNLSAKCRMLKLIGWSLLIWSAEGLVFWCVAMSLPALDNPLAGYLAFPVGTLATLIPSTPGYIGTFDYFSMQAMMQLGNSSASATAYALLLHVLLWLPPTCIGGAYLCILHIQKLRKKKSYEQ